MNVYLISVYRGRRINKVIFKMINYFEFLTHFDLHFKVFSTNTCVYGVFNENLENIIF